MAINSEADAWAGPDQPRHPLLLCADALEAALKDVADVDPLFAPTQVKREALVRLTTLKGRLESLRMGVIANSHDVADADGARSVASWLAPQVHTGAASESAAENLACDLKAHYPLLREALSRGDANVAQAAVIRGSLNELRRIEGVTPAILTEAEEILVAECANLGPKDLKTAADAVLECIDSEFFTDAERKKLEAELERARAATRLTMRKRGDGSTDVSARIPDSLALRLKSYLESFTSPRHEHTEGAEASSSLADGAVCSRYRDPATGERLPHDRMMGEAFCAFLERYDPNRMPKHGGMATTLVITTQLDALTGQLSVGTLPDGTRLAAGDLRRLACNAQILPAVLGGKSAVLDLGTSRRLFSLEQRIALGMAHPTCQASGCSVPSAWCEAHHRTEWSRGGPTDLANGMLLCSFHHQRIHDDSYLVKEMPDGDVRFARRR